MKSRKTIHLILGMLLLAGVLTGSRPPAEVICCLQPAEALGKRLDWAIGEAETRGYKGGIWVAYSIRRMMGENSFIGSFSCPGRDQEGTLEEMIAGKKRAIPQLSDRERLQSAARAALNDLERTSKTEKKIWKNIAILLKYGQGQARLLQKVDMSNLSLRFDLEGLSLFWLGEATDEQSLSLIQALYAKASVEEAKKALIEAAGIHGTARLVIPILEKVLNSGQAVQLRKSAAFWLSQQMDETVLPLLLQTAKTDRDEDIRKEAVFGISQLNLDPAVDALIDLARHASETRIRCEAIFWLGQEASKKAAAALHDFASKEGNSEIQEQAVFALSQLPGEEGVASLIKIARTHPNPDVRKKAIFWLGESQDPRALETLIEIIKGK
jgi:hypothetical protein